MKNRVFFILLVVLFASRDAVWAADKGVPGQSIDLLNDDIKADDLNQGNSVYDPLEPMNRVFFEFNDKLYFWVLKPVKTGYSAVVAEDIRRCFGNFFDNIASPVSFVNNLLQGRLEDSGVVLSRFAINTTMGIFGFPDAASEVYHITPRPADFGQTLGVYGFGAGVYVVWPVIGPSNIRDSVGFVGDIYAHPVTYLDWDMAEQTGYYMGNKINAMSLRPDVYEDLKKMSLDPYVAARQAYAEHRQDQIDRQKR
jgi:phospholipid-binding lipoprotein MlaA